MTHQFRAFSLSRLLAWVKAMLGFGHLPRFAGLVSATLLLASMGWVAVVAPTHAAQDRYEYDPLGRLITHIDSTGQATQYQYDAAGNILRVTRGAASALQPPQVAGVAPAVLRRGQTRQIVITGTALQNVGIQSPTTELLLSNVQRTATSVTLDLSATANAPQGAHTLTLSNIRGSAQATVSVAPALPVMAVEPSPLALPPTASQHTVTLRLSHADLEAHTIALSSSDTTRLSVSPASVQVPAGQTTATFSVSGLAAGFASLNLSSTTLAPLSVPVFLTADFRGLSTSRAQPVGVRVGQPVTPPPPQVSGTFFGPLVGLSRGSVITAVAPKALVVGELTTLVISGHHLPEGAQAVLEPADGIGLSAITRSADGQTLQLPVTVAASAAHGLRRLSVLGPDGQAVPMTDPALGQLYVGAGAPAIASVDPLFGVGGTTVELTVRGQRLQGGVLSFLPAHDLIVETPSVNADGTVLTARVQIASFAATGARTVRVTTPSGASPDQAAVGNQFTVVQQIRENITPVTAALVGVQVGATTQPPQTQAVGPFLSRAVGIAVGAHGRAIEPAVGVIGTAPELLIRGQGLSAVASVVAATAEDSAGLVLGAPAANAEGTELRFTATIAPNAPRSLRRLRLLTAQGLEIPLLEPGFTVSAPLPELLSVTPQVLMPGQTVALRVRGLRLAGASAVRLVPAEGISLSLPVAGSDADAEFSVSLQIAANAPLGERVLVVTTAAGESSAVASPANSLRLVQQAGATLDSIAAPLVGVQVGQGGGAGPASVNYLGQSALVGISVQTEPAQPLTTSGLFQSGAVGISVGPVVASHAPEVPDGFLKGAQGVLVVDGLRLQTVDQIEVEARPSGASAQSIVFGQPAAQADGTRVQVPVSVAANAPSGAYRLRLSAQGQPVPSLWQAVGFAVGALPERIDSVSHIVLQQGQTYPVTVRGLGFSDVYHVVVDGGSGIEVVPGTVQAGSDAFGQFVLVQLRVLPDAPLGSRVLRLQVPGGLTPATPTPANTLTVIAP